MNQKITTNLLLIMLIVAIGIVGYFLLVKKPTQVGPSKTGITQSETSVTYTNNKYGFNFLLPISWKGYFIIEENWEGSMIDGTEGKIIGPKIIIRNPLWKIEVPRQDIPIMVFTLAQWDLILKEKLSVGAAPIGPSELGRNTKYVFALPARYNFAYPVGFEEVQQIIDNKPLKSI